MGFKLEKGLDNLSNKMESILQRSEELIELAGYKRKYQNIKEKVEERFIILGKLMYESYLQGEGIHEPYRRIYKEIDELQKTMKEIGKKINELKKNSYHNERKQ